MVMDKDENQIALQEIKALTNQLQLSIERFSDEEVFASCFDIHEVDHVFSEVEELTKKVRNQIDLMQQSAFAEEEEMRNRE